MLCLKIPGVNHQVHPLTTTKFIHWPWWLTSRSKSTLRHTPTQSPLQTSTVRHSCASPLLRVQKCSLLFRSFRVTWKPITGRIRKGQNETKCISKMILRVEIALWRYVLDFMGVETMFYHDRIIWNNLSVSQETPQFSHAGLLPGLPVLGARLPSQSGEQRMGTQLFPPTDLGRSGQMPKAIQSHDTLGAGSKSQYPKMINSVSTCFNIDHTQWRKFGKFGDCGISGMKFPMFRGSLRIPTETRQLVLSKDQFISKKRRSQKYFAAGLDLDILRLFGVNVVSP